MRCKYCGAENTEIRQIRREMQTDEDNPQTVDKLIYTVDYNSCGSVSEYQALKDIVAQYVADILEIEKESKRDCPSNNCPIVYGHNYVLCHTCGTPPIPKQNRFE